MSPEENHRQRLRWKARNSKDNEHETFDGTCCEGIIGRLLTF